MVEAEMAAREMTEVGWVVTGVGWVAMGVMEESWMVITMGVG